ncbi:MAG: UPF0280 family protein [Labrys sp. (in: a-proteobacteria)]
MSATIQRLTGGRLHLQHGPIDVVLKAFGTTAEVVRAEEAAAAAFPALLPGLVDELPLLRQPVGPEPRGPVARRMVEACRPFEPLFITPMAAVAGSVADELLATMLAAAPLERAFVNDGGDIAIHLAPGTSLAVGMVTDYARGPTPRVDGRIHLTADHGVGGIATSGAQGRSFSLGIADAVTVLAATAAAADAAATLIANAVDVEGEAVTRVRAMTLDPDSDLGERLVTVAVGPLTSDQIEAALAAGLDRAEGFRHRGLIIAAALTLRGRTVTTEAWLALPAGQTGEA